MARSHAARSPGRRWGTGLARRRPPRMAGAVVAVALTAAPLALLAGAASAGQANAEQPAAGPVVLTVTSVSPGFAEPGQDIMIRGVVRNVTDSALPALSVGMSSSQTPLSSVAAPQEFVAGRYPVSLAPLNVKPYAISALGGRTTAQWVVRVPVKALGLSCFGVYPFAAQVSYQSGPQLASSPIPLPFWPKSPRSCQASPRPRPAHIAWIWPLIDSPHQGPCPGVLLDNALAGRVQAGGRLYALLAAASEYAAKGARLTWAIDPALLDSLALMRQPYQVSAVEHGASCGGTTRYPASAAATAWLSKLVRATRGQTVFATPYADVDIAALARHGHSSDTDLYQAFKDGQRIAGHMLNRSPVPARLPAGGSRLAAVAWPAGGAASAVTLENLAATLKINTVVLAQPFSAASYPAGGYMRLITGSGLPVNALLADSSLSQLLRSRAASSRQPAAIAGTSQLFLAETAMNIAADPSVPRPIVVTPPRQWNPAGSLADALLADTIQAPWLTPSTIGQLVSLPQQRAAGPITQARAGAELSNRLLGKVGALSKKIGLLESIIGNADPTLRRAVFGIESSWWRGAGGIKRALTLLERTSQFVSDQFGQLSLGGNQYVTLGGTSGSVIVSVRNGLSYPVNVRLHVQVTNINGTVNIVGGPTRQITVAPGKVAEPKVSVHATQTGSAVLHFSLTAPSGVVLPRGRLTMQVRASNFGRIALIICAAALAVFVLASAIRAIRHGRPAPPGPAGQDDPSGPPDPQAHELASPGGGEGGAGTARSDQASPAQSSPAQSSPAQSSPAQSGQAESAWLDRPGRRDEPDSVIMDRSELTPAGQTAGVPGVAIESGRAGMPGVAAESSRARMPGVAAESGRAADRRLSSPGRQRAEESQ